MKKDRVSNARKPKLFPHKSHRRKPINHLGDCDLCDKEGVKTKKTASFEAVFVPGAGVEPARFPTGV